MGEPYLWRTANMFRKTCVVKQMQSNPILLSAIDISSLLNASLSTDPDSDYERFEKKSITEMYDEYCPEKCAKFDKYKHKLSNWITPGILKSIEFRDKLFKRLKAYSSEKSEYERLKHNLKLYNGSWINASGQQRNSATTTNLANIKMMSERHGIH